MNDNEFSVWQFFKDKSHVPECKFVSTEEAVNKFIFLTNNVSAKIGVTQKVIITDGGDNTVMEWIHGEGITFPPELKGKELNRKVKSE